MAGRPAGWEDGAVETAPEITAQIAPKGVDGTPERWVFGYGSLMWRPGFDYVEREPALLEDVHRAFCISSVHHRGTPERPGLVLGLAPGGRTQGMAYRVSGQAWTAVYAYLREREQPTETYVESQVVVRLGRGRTVSALTFVSDQDHPQWAGVLSRGEQARRIAGATGLSGRNIDYLADLVGHLRAAGCPDAEMEQLLAEVQRLEGEAPAVQA